MRRPRRPHRSRDADSLYAAVDLGTNNCRLLIAERRAAGFQIVDSHSNLVRLGEGLAGSGRISDQAVERGLTALKQIRAKLKRRGVGKVRCIATEACRKAENGADFVERVRQETGLTFKIVSPAEEARLAVVGCHDLVAEDAETVMVLDIGGGSTEIAFVDAVAMREAGLPGLCAKAPIEAWRSFKLGVVTLAESFPDLEEVEAYEAMAAHAREVFGAWKRTSALAERMAGATAHIIGTSGTVTCLAGVHLKLDRYRRDAVDGTWMSCEQVGAVVAKMCEAGLEGRARFPTIGRERADLMLSGCAIFQAALDTWPSSRVRVGDRGLREGLLLTMMHGPKKPRRRRRASSRSASAGPEASDAG